MSSARRVVTAAYDLRGAAIGAHGDLLRCGLSSPLRGIRPVIVSRRVHKEIGNVCGIAGEIRWRGDADVEAVARVTAALSGRGPDGHGEWHDGPVALGHRRLRIIDLSDGGAQPMVDDDHGLVVVF